MIPQTMPFAMRCRTLEYGGHCLVWCPRRAEGHQAGGSLLRGWGQFAVPIAMSTRTSHTTIGVVTQGCAGGRTRLGYLGSPGRCPRDPRVPRGYTPSVWNAGLRLGSTSPHVAVEPRPSEGDGPVSGAPSEIRAIVPCGEGSQAARALQHRPPVVPLPSQQDPAIGSSRRRLHYF